MSDTSGFTVNVIPPGDSQAQANDEEQATTPRKRSDVSDLTSSDEETDDEEVSELGNTSSTSHYMDPAKFPPRQRAATTVFQSAPGGGVSRPRRPSNVSDEEEEKFDALRSNLRRLQLITDAAKNSAYLKHRKTSTLTRKDTNLTQMLAEEVEELYKTIQKKDDDLKLAAGIGQTLLAKVDEQTDLIVDLEDRLDESEKVAKLIKAEKAQLRRDTKRKTMELEDIEQTISDLRDKNRELKAQLDKIQDTESSKRAEVESQLHERIQRLESSNSAQNARIEELTTALEDAEFETTQARKQVDGLELEVASLQQQLRMAETKASSSAGPAANVLPGNDRRRSSAERVRTAAGASASTTAVSSTASADPASQQQLKLLRGELSGIQQQLSTAQQENFVLTSRVEELNTVQKDLTRQLRAKSTALQDAQARLRTSVDTNGTTSAKVRVSYESNQFLPHAGQIPTSATVMKYSNSLNALAMAVVAGISFSGEPDVDTFAAIFTITWSALWLLFELRTAVLEADAQEVASFMYTRGGRALFFALTMILCFGLRQPGYGVALFTLLNASFNLYVLFEHPSLASNLLARAAKNNGLGPTGSLRTPLLDEDNFDSAPLVARPSVDTSYSHVNTQNNSGPSRSRTESYTRDELDAGLDEPPSPSMQDDDEPENWSKQRDSTTGRVYYFNKATGFTSFERPVSLGPSE